MNETCREHYLNMPDIGGCPYCEITRLTAENERYRKALRTITTGALITLRDIAREALEVGGE